MENPNTWNDIQKLINNSDQDSKSIIKVLEDNNKLKSTPIDLSKIISTEFEVYQSDLKDGMCGYSFGTRVYYKLLELDVLK